jgi:hypothetical protein
MRLCGPLRVAGIRGTGTRFRHVNASPDLSFVGLLKEEAKAKTATLTPYSPLAAAIA